MAHDVYEYIRSAPQPQPYQILLTSFMEAGNELGVGIQVIEEYVAGFDLPVLHPGHDPVVRSTLHSFGMRDPVEDLAYFIRRQGWKIKRVVTQTVEFERVFSYKGREHVENIAILRGIAMGHYVG